MRARQSFAFLLAALMLHGCGGFSLGGWSFMRGTKVDTPGVLPSGRAQTTVPAPALIASEKAHDVVLFALGLVETGYRFGGKNPEAGLDCSGMVHYVFNQVTELKLAGSAADLARLGKVIDRDALQPGDLVFFNTLNRPYSHVGIYIGDDRFVHAPSSGGKVRTESLREGWFAARFEEARTYFD
jgi:cell wall-associated NlpC family hydrolase